MTFWRTQCYEISMKIMQVAVPDGHGKEQLKLLADYLPELCLFQGPWLAGGNVRRMLMGERVDTADLDYFFNEYHQYNTACKKIERVADAVLWTSRASTYRVPLGDKSQIVQFINKSYFGNVIDLMKSFDFRVCQFFTDGNNIMFPEKAFEDAKNMRLRIAYGGELHTEGLYSRLHKYTQYGFRPDPKLIWAALTKIRKARQWELDQLSAKTHSDSKEEKPDPTGLGPSWVQLKPKETIRV